MPAGRPIEYNESYVERAKQYIEECIDEIEEYHKTRGEKSDTFDRIVRVRLPTIEGLAVYLKISRDTLYRWEKEYERFSYIIDELRAIQADRLLNNGLSGDYNPTIAKVLLTKHGYTDKTETDITSGGEKIMIMPPELIKKNESPQSTVDKD